MRKFSMKTPGTPAIVDSRPNGSAGVSVPGEGARAPPRAPAGPAFVPGPEVPDCGAGGEAWLGRWACCACTSGAAGGRGVVVAVVGGVVPVDSTVVVFVWAGASGE